MIEDPDIYQNENLIFYKNALSLELSSMPPKFIKEQKRRVNEIGDLETMKAQGLGDLIDDGGGEEFEGFDDPDLPTDIENADVIVKGMIEGITKDLLGLTV